MNKTAFKLCAILEYDVKYIHSVNFNKIFSNSKTIGNEIVR